MPQAQRHTAWRGEPGSQEGQPGMRERKDGAGTRKLKLREDVICLKSHSGLSHRPCTWEHCPSRVHGQWSQGKAGRDETP